MKAKKLLCYVFILQLVVVLYPGVLLLRTSANIAPVSMTISGVIIPETTLDYVQLEEASILYDLQADGPRFGVNYSGNYTLSNSNETVDIMVAAPFYIHGNEYFSLQDYAENITLKVNGGSVDYILKDYTLGDFSGFENYLYPENHTVIVANVTLAAEANTTLSYSYAFYVREPLNRFNISHNVGIHNLWSDTLNQTIEFNIEGDQPDIYSPNVWMADFDGGTRYVWYMDPSTSADTEYISIEYTMRSIAANTAWYIIIFAFIVVPFVAIPIISNYREKRRK